MFRGCAKVESRQVPHTPSGGPEFHEEKRRELSARSSKLPANGGPQAFRTRLEAGSFQPGRSQRFSLGTPGLIRPVQIGEEPLGINLDPGHRGGILDGVDRTGLPP